ncbi:hypothetical protein RJ639_015337 [Escallonia herrerae]|uniref:NAC domain-containing protein n=1 Tax=Escallonia herrerae TaxID=1293975 RepID=A0AA88VIB7_9ASTE|nr:hypothetical protein RJ639_015337 [Escallonia herrerae]
MSDIEKNKEERTSLPGFRFHPTDEELVGFYLRRKVEKKPLSIELIKQVDIYKYDPWDLPRVSAVGDNEGYFFCIRGRKYRNSIRPNRVTGSGFWKATGIDRPVYANPEETNDCIGLKKSLVYYLGSAGKSTKTDWMMHEFRLPPTWKTTDQENAKNVAAEAVSSLSLLLLLGFLRKPIIKRSLWSQEVWTLCRIFKRNASYKKYTSDLKQTTSRQSTTDAISKTWSLD